MTILEMQDAIQLAGWQWKERVYNDGDPYDCYAVFTNSKDCLYFDSQELRTRERVNGVLQVGWGRFSRSLVWHQAYNYIVLGSRRSENE